MPQFLDTLGVIPTTSPIQFGAGPDSFLQTPGSNGSVPSLLSQPAQAANYLNGVRQTAIQGAGLVPLVRIGDGNLSSLWELDGIIKSEAEELLEDSGKLIVTVAWENWIQDLLVNETLLVEDLHIIVDWDRTNPNWRTRWGGKIVEVHIKQDGDGKHTIELSALHHREHAKHLLVAANPIFPPEIQLPRMWVMPGPCRTILATTALINLGRLFVPGWSGIASGLDPAGWLNPLNPDAVLNLLPTEWPIQVAFVDPVLDQSRWTCIGTTWQNWHDSFKDLLSDSGVAMKAYTYLTTDADSPNTELVDLVQLIPELLAQIPGISVAGLEAGLARLCSPQRNCVVFAFEDVSGVTGPTGTIADGLLSTVAVTLDDLITPVLVNVKTGDTYDAAGVLNGLSVEDSSGLGQTYLLEQLLNVAVPPPKVIWWDGTFNGRLSANVTYHKGSPKTIMTGGKSPVIINEAQTFAIKYGLSQLQTVITDGFIQEFGGAPQGAGLDNLYQGQLDNVLFAWERFTDPMRALYAGDLAWQEHFERGSGAAYTLASVLTLRSGNWKTRPFAGFDVSTLNCFPWIYGVDYTLGDRVGFEQDGVIYVDNIYTVKHTWEWEKPLTIVNRIGEDKKKADPFGAAFKTIATLYTFISQLAGEGTIFQG